MTVIEQASHAKWNGTRTAPPMFIWEFLAAATCVLVNLLDGFDILIMSVAAPSIGADLGLASTQVGLMFSSGLAGMMVGALSLAPLSDRLGRRAVILACLAINIVGMFSTGLSRSLAELMIFRFITGLGVGGMMPTVNTAIAEVVHESRRNLAVIIQCAAYPCGGLLAAVLWPVLIANHSWHQIIQAACLPSLVCLVLAALFLPETVPFLLSRRPANALEKINATLRRARQPLLEALPPAAGAESMAGPTAGSMASASKPGFHGPVRRNLIALSAVAFMAQFSFYFFISWLPAVMVSSLTAGKTQGSGAILLNLGGIAGGLILAGLSVRLPMGRLTSSTMFLAFVSVGALTLCLNDSSLTGPIAALVGAALFALMAGIYGIAPTVFPALSRAGGLGVAFSVGRFGGVLSPWLGALLLHTQGVSVGMALLVMATPLAIGGVLVSFLRPIQPTGESVQSNLL